MKNQKKKSLISKILLGTVFTLGLMLVISVSEVKAATFELETRMEDDGSGSTGSTYIPATSTTTTSSNIRTGDIIFTSSLNKEKYKPGEDIFITSTTSVNVCSNTTTNLKADAYVPGEDGPKVKVLDVDIAGGSKVFSSVSVPAPQTPGSYVVRVDVTDYSQAGYFLMKEEGKPYAFAVNYPFSTGKDGELQYGQSSLYFISTDGQGKVLSISGDFGPGSLSGIEYLYDVENNNNRVKVKAETGGLLRTASFDTKFIVEGAEEVSVKVYANDIEGKTTIGAGEEATIKWKIINGTQQTICNCYMKEEGSATETSCGSSTDSLGDKYSPQKYKVNKKTTFSVTCN